MWCDDIHACKSCDLWDSNMDLDASVDGVTPFTCSTASPPPPFPRPPPPPSAPPVLQQYKPLALLHIGPHPPPPPFWPLASATAKNNNPAAIFSPVTSALKKEAAEIERAAQAQKDATKLKESEQAQRDAMKLKETQADANREAALARIREARIKERQEARDAQKRQESRQDPHPLSDDVEHLLLQQHASSFSQPTSRQRAPPPPPPPSPPEPSPPPPAKTVHSARVSISRVESPRPGVPQTSGLPADAKGWHQDMVERVTAVLVTGLVAFAFLTLFVRGFLAWREWQSRRNTAEERYFPRKGLAESRVIKDDSVSTLHHHGREPSSISGGVVDYAVGSMPILLADGNDEEADFILVLEPPVEQQHEPEGLQADNDELDRDQFQDDPAVNGCVDGDQHRMHVQNVDDHVDQRVENGMGEETEHQHEEERTWSF